MDMSLPVLDGWEATRRIKAAPDTRRIPIIGLTAHTMATDRDKSVSKRVATTTTPSRSSSDGFGKIERLLGTAA